MSSLETLHRMESWTLSCSAKTVSRLNYPFRCTMGFQREDLVCAFALPVLMHVDHRIVPQALNPVFASASSLAQPIPMDMNGDLKIDLFGTIPSSSSNGPFQVWRNVWNNSQASSAVFELYVSRRNGISLLISRLTGLCGSREDPKMTGAQCKLSDPHSNAAVDLNGDCLAGKNSPSQYTIYLTTVS